MLHLVHCGSESSLHFLCRLCFRRYATETVTSGGVTGIKCPDPSCKSFFPPSTVRDNLSTWEVLRMDDPEENRNRSVALAGDNNAMHVDVVQSAQVAKGGLSNETSKSKEVSNLLKRVRKPPAKLTTAAVEQKEDNSDDEGAEHKPSANVHAAPLRATKRNNNNRPAAENSPRSKRLHQTQKTQSEVQVAVAELVTTSNGDDTLLVKTLLGDLLSGLAAEKPTGHRENIALVLDAVFAEIPDHERGLDITNKVLTSCRWSFSSVDRGYLDELYAVVDAHYAEYPESKVDEKAARFTHHVMSCESSFRTAEAAKKLVADLIDGDKLAFDFDSLEKEFPDETHFAEIMKKVSKRRLENAKKEAARSSSDLSSMSVDGATSQDGESSDEKDISGMALDPPLLHLSAGLNKDAFAKQLISMLKHGVLFDLHDLGEFKEADVVSCGSFAVNQSMLPVVSRNFHVDGYSGGLCAAMTYEKAMLQILRDKGLKVVSFDAIHTVYDAAGLDKSVPQEAKVQLAVSCENIVSLKAMHVLGLGKHCNDALKCAYQASKGDGKICREDLGSRWMSYGPTDDSENTQNVWSLRHPTVLSTFLSGNKKAREAADGYDVIFSNICGEEISSRLWGLVLKRGLRSDKYQGVGGCLGAAITDRAEEIITRKATRNPHEVAIRHCSALGVTTDEEAASVLSNRGCELQKPLTRTALFLSDVGWKGGKEAAARMRAYLLLTEFRLGDMSGIDRAYFDARNIAAREEMTPEDGHGVAPSGGYLSKHPGGMAVTPQQVLDIVETSKNALTVEQVLTRIRHHDGCMFGGKWSPIADAEAKGDVQ